MPGQATWAKAFAHPAEFAVSHKMSSRHDYGNGEVALFAGVFAHFKHG